MPMWGYLSLDTYSSNGERIYFTAVNDEGELIPYDGGPDFGGMMMSAYLTCNSCHGPEGRGGLHQMHMWWMEAPDIRLGVMDESEHESGHEEFDLDAFRQAVVEGKHSNGEPLSPDMPRWSLKDDDLADLYEFLSSLP